MRRTRAAALALALCLAAATPALAAPTIYGYQEGLAQAEEGGLWGFADASGEIVIPIQYQSVLSFQLGVALVQTNGKLGAIRQDGSYLIEPVYDTLEDIGYGLYIGQRGDSWGLVSLVPFEEEGSLTQDFYPFVYSAIRADRLDGLEVLVLTRDGQDALVSLSDLPGQMQSRGVPSSQFPLVKGRLPSFSDVGPGDWYAVWVDLAYDLDLMQGVGEGRFAPDQVLTVAEAVKMAAFLESRYTGDSFHQQPAAGSPWYRSSVAYCEASGILEPGQFDDYQRPITRLEMARLFAATSLGRSMPEINDLERVRQSVPDLDGTEPDAEAAYRLYAQGVLTGSDGALTFRPGAPLTRAEAAAVAARMARAEQRVRLWG